MIYRVRLSFAIVSTFAATVAAVADEFIWEVSGGLRQADGVPGLETDTTALEASYYLDPVDEDLGPLTLVPFFSRSSRISITAQRFEDKQTTSYTLPFGGLISGGPVIAEYDSIPVASGSMRQYSIAGELFPTSRIGVTIGFTDFDDAPASEVGYQIAATWFFRQRVAAEFSLSRTRVKFGQASTVDEDEDEASRTITGRLQGSGPPR